MLRRIAVIILSAVAVLSANVAGAEPLGVTVLPQPGGESPVGTTVLHLVDDGRADPFHPDRRRELMVSVFYPAAKVDGHPRAHYASTELIPSLEQRFGVELPGLHTNSYSGAPAAAGSHPVLLYSPGAGVTRLLGTGLAEDLASRGYVVVTIDHTYEAPAVEFPGGRIVAWEPAPEFDTALRQKYVDTRLPDVRFVLDSLERLARGTNPDAGQRTLPEGLARALDLDRIGMVGHSSGGYVAVESMHLDRRIGAAVNLDGQIGVDAAFGKSVTEGVDRPVLVMTSEQAEEVGDAHPSLDEFWRTSTGWKRQLTMRDSAHYDYTDFPLLVPTPARDSAKTYIGPIPADRASTLTRTYVAAMFDKFLRDRADTVLDGPPREPEITVVR
ncbi:alpha/beta hydrolase family protein [Nocardia cyriacigeorgica]|uniref:alpha/beta hydrolase family protein n=1 Tax=Nocardia cyriacigeorgica TaxID=135487 RepID=UPI0035125C08